MSENTTSQQDTKFPSKDQKKIKYVGLSNQGATCYMNSLLQTLFMTPEFRNALYRQEYQQSKGMTEQDCIPLQLQLLFAKLQTFQDSDSLDTKSLIQSFQWDPNESFKQHDVQEFTTVLFDAIEESFRDTDQEYIIKDLFQGISLRYVKCKKCLNESFRDDNFLYLSLIVKDDIEKVYNPTIEKGLENYLKPCYLEGDNKYFCDNCNEKNDAEMGVKIATLPEILIIHLNRFDLDMMTLNRRKLNNKVTFPYVLNMNKFLKPYEEIIKDNDSKSQGIKFQDQKFQEGGYLDNNLDVDKIGKSGTYEDSLDKKSPSKSQHSTNPLVDMEISKATQDDKNLNEAEKKAIKEDTLASLKESKRQFDQKIKTKEPSSENKQYDVNEPTLLEALAESEQKQQEIREKEKEKYSKMYSEENDFMVRETKIHNAQQSSLIDFYLQEGDRVYELYSIMIHTGSAWGGHYYSYIKSFEDGLWYDFDDRNVTRISVEKIEQVYGEEIPKRNMGCSAYMLFYRLVTNQTNKIIDLPKTMEKMMENQREIELQKQAEERRRKEEQERQLPLKVYYKGKDFVVIPSKTETINDLTMKVMEECGVEETLENFRLRGYAPYENLMQQHYVGKENETLESLGFKPYKNLIVETKRDDEQFEEYDPNKIIVKVNKWRPDLVELDEHTLLPERIAIDEKAPLKDLMERIENKFKIPQSKQIVAKRNPYGNMTDCEVLNKFEDSISKNLSFHRVFNGVNLYLEEGEYKDGEKTLWEKEFDKEKHRVIIKFNDPNNSVEGEGANYENQITIDNRKTLGELKRVIAEKLNLDINKFIMKKNGRLGPELRDLHLKISDFNSLSYASIYIMFGQPSKSGEYKLIFHMGSLSMEPHDSLHYEYEELLSLGIGSFETVSEVKDQLIEELKKKNPAIELDKSFFRLRERNASYPGAILHDQKIMKDYTLYDRKAIIIEKLVEPAEYHPEFIMVHVKFWDAQEFELGDVKEVFFHRDQGTLHELGLQLENIYSIPVEELESCKVSSLQNFTKADLLSENWFELQGNGHKINNYPWYIMKDGCLIIVKQKGSKPTQEKIEEMRFAKKKPKTGQTEQGKKVNLQLSMPKETSIKIQVKKNTANTEVEKKENNENEIKVEDSEQQNENKGDQN